MASEDAGRAAPPAEDAERTAARLQAILEAAVDGIITIDASGRIAAANAAAERIFGYALEQMLGQNVAVLMPRPYRDEHDRYLARYLATGERRIIGIGREVVGLRKDGSTFPMDLAVGEACAHGERLFTAVVRDLSERKRLEEQLIQAQKMEAIGRVAGGIAHDFNNLLAVILSSSELLLRNPRDERERRAAERVRQASERGARLTRQLLAFSRRDRARNLVIDLNHEIGAMRDLLGRLIGEDVQLKLHLTAAPSTVRIDPAHLDQVLMNLAVNAGDAMPHGGELRVETQTVRLDADGTAAELGLECGVYVVLIVEDTGTGIDPEHLPHVFEPFFTTKPEGRGTGLGLATVQAIVSRGGGAIAVRSRLGEGTRFEVYLPYVAGSAASETERTTGAQARATGKVLIVEDDALLRDLALEVLEDEGYSVRAAASPDEALLALRSPGSLDLLLSDVVMPGMPALELVRRVRMQHPRVRVLFMSGYADAQLADRGQEVGADLLRKPFNATELSAKVAEVMGRER